MCCAGVCAPRCAIRSPPSWREPGWRLVLQSRNGGQPAGRVVRGLRHRGWCPPPGPDRGARRRSRLGAGGQDPDLRSDADLAGLPIRRQPRSSPPPSDGNGRQFGRIPGRHRHADPVAAADRGGFRAIASGGSALLPVIARLSWAATPVSAFILAALDHLALPFQPVAFILLLVALSARGLVAGSNPLGLVMVIGANLGGGADRGIHAVADAAFAGRPGPSPSAISCCGGAGAIAGVGRPSFFLSPPGASPRSAPRRPLQDRQTRISPSTVALVIRRRAAGRARPPLRRIGRWPASRHRRLRIVSPPNRAHSILKGDRARQSTACASANATTGGHTASAETIEVMIKGVADLYEEADRDRIAALAALDDRVDRRHAGIKALSCPHRAGWQ